jgi:hypothetical protein
MEVKTITYDDLYVGDLQIVADGITLASGQNLVRGAVLGMITATKKYVLSLTAAVDGSQNPVAVLGIDCNATAGDVSTTALFMGEFNAAKCVFGAGHTAATVNAAFRAQSTPIFIRTF